MRTLIPFIILFIYFHLTEQLQGISTQLNFENDCTENKNHRKLLIDGVIHLTDNLPPTNLHVTFQQDPDPCLIESLWLKGIAAKILTKAGLEESLQSSSYKHPTQIILWGDIPWITSILKEAAVYYSSAKLNALKSRWLWVQIPSESHKQGTFNQTQSPLPFTEAMEDISNALVEGVRGLFISMEERKENPEGFNPPEEAIQRWVSIGAIDAPGDGSWRLKYSGTWISSQLQLVRPLWPGMPFNFQGRLVRIGCLKKPTVFFFDKENAQLKDTNGYAADLAYEVQKRLNFTDVLVPNTGFGAFRNGTWNGMVGDLFRGKSDVSPTDFTPIWQRTLVIDFGLIYSTDPVVIISKSPTVYMKPLLVLEIFTPIVWCGMVAIGFAAGMALGIMMKLKHILGPPGYDRIFGVMTYVAASWKIIIMQASNKIWPSWIGGKLIGGCMMFLAVVVGSLYRGSITAFLAIPFRSQPINSLEEMLERNVVPAIRLLSSPYSFFLTENSGVLGERVRQIMVTFSGSQLSSWEFLKQVADGKYAWIDTASSAVGRSGQYEEIGKQCLYHVARNPVRMDLDAFGFPKNSFIKYQFDEIMRWYRNYGIIEQMKKKYYSQDCISVAASNGPQIISITQVQGAFYVLGIGLLLAAIFLVMEKVLHIILQRK